MDKDGRVRHFKKVGEQIPERRPEGIRTSVVKETVVLLDCSSAKPQHFILNAHNSPLEGAMQLK